MNKMCIRDRFNTAGLVIDPKMHQGFDFEVHDLIENKKVVFHCPEEIYDMLVFIGAPGRYCIKSVYSRTLNEIAATSSTQRLNLMAGRYVGKDDPVCIVRCQSGMPAVGEVLEPFSKPHLVSGWMRGSHHGPLMPCSEKASTPTRFDGPPRVVALGFQLCNGKLVGPQDFLYLLCTGSSETVSVWTRRVRFLQDPRCFLRFQLLHL